MIQMKPVEILKMDHELNGLNGYSETSNEEMSSDPVSNEDEIPDEEKVSPDEMIIEGLFETLDEGQVDKRGDPLSVKNEDSSQDSYQNQEVTDEIVIEDSQVSSVAETQKRKRKRSQLDQLLDTSDKTPKRPKNDIVELPKLKGEGDIFCWTCHRPGPFMAVCTLCRRIYHATKCSNLNRVVPDNWVCYECKAIEEEKQQAELNSCTFDPESLNSLLMMVTEKLENAKDAGPFKTAVDPYKYPDYTEYVHTPMNLFEIKKKIAKNAYDNIYSFILDLKTIVHNSYIYNTAISGLTFTARSLLRKGIAFIQDMRQCPECFIHAFLCNKKGFVEACTRVHMPVWAKFKGYPFWPAKLMKLVEPDEHDNETFVQVKFFGDHNRANVSTSNVYLLSEKTPTKWIPKHCSSSFKDASDEMSLYIDNLEAKFSQFVFAPPYTKFDPTVSLTDQIRIMLPNYPENQSTKVGKLKLMQKVNLMRKKTYEKNEDSKALGVLFARLSDQSPEEFGLSISNSPVKKTELKDIKCESNENVGPMMTKHLKKLSKAEIDALRLNDRKKTNGLLSPKEIVVQKHQLPAKNVSVVRNDILSKNQFILPKVDNRQHTVQVKKIDLSNKCLPNDEKSLIKEAFPNINGNSLVQLIRVQKPIQSNNPISMDKNVFQNIKIINTNSLEKAQRPLNSIKRVELDDKAQRIPLNKDQRIPLNKDQRILLNKDQRILLNKDQRILLNKDQRIPLNKDQRIPLNKDQFIKNQNSILKPQFNAANFISCNPPKMIKQFIPIKIGSAKVAENAGHSKANNESSSVVNKIKIPSPGSMKVAENTGQSKAENESSSVMNKIKIAPLEQRSRISLEQPKSLERADSAESSIPRHDSDENQSDNQDEVEGPSESKTVIAVRRDLFVSDRDDSSAPSLGPDDYNFTIKRTVKKFEKRPITLEEFTRVLNQGKTLEQVINIACKGLESLKNHYTEKTIDLTNECAKQIQSLDGDKVKIGKMAEQRFNDKVKRMEKVNEARVKKLKVLYEDRIKQVKLRQWCCVCKRAANLYCCYKSYYCGLTCQDSDWPTHKDHCQQQTMVASDPFLSLNPNHRDLLDKEEDINEDKKAVMEKMSSTSKTSESTATPVNPENNLNLPNAVPVLPNQPVTISPLPTQISTLFSLSSDPTKDVFPLLPTYPKMLGGKKLKLILPKPPAKV